MDPLIQHMNNVFQQPMLMRTAADCAEALKQLNSLLDIQHLQAAKFYFIINTTPPELKKTEFPGIEKSQAILQTIWPLVSSRPLQAKQNTQFYVQQSNYVLNFLQLVRSSLELLTEATGPLTDLAWKHRLRLERDALLENNPTPTMTAEDVAEELSLLMFGAKCASLKKVLRTVELVLVQTRSSFELLGLTGSFVQNVNQLSARSGLKSIQIEMLRDSALGCESEIPLKELEGAAQLAQMYIADSQVFGVNGLAALVTFASKLAELTDRPAKQLLNKLLQEETEFQIENTQNLTSQKRAFAYVIYMLCGSLFQFGEQEFYLSVAVLLEALTKVISKIVKPENQKQRKGCRSSQPEPDFEQDITASQVLLLIQKMSNIVKPLAKTGDHQEVRLNFTIYDQDLAKLVSQLGGAQRLYNCILQLFTALKAGFKTSQISCILEGITVLVTEANEPRSHAAVLAAQLSDSVRDLSFEPGLVGINQLLEIVDLKLNSALAVGSVHDDITALQLELMNNEGEQ